MAHEQPVTSDNEYAYTAVFEPAEEGGYVVTFPTIPNLATQAESLDEARAMAVDCLRCYLEGRVKDGLPLPESERKRTTCVRTGTKPSSRALEEGVAIHGK